MPKRLARRLSIGMKGFELAERRDQGIELRAPDALGNRRLRTCPVRPCAPQRSQSLGGSEHFPGASVAARRDLDEVALNQGIEVARERRTIEKLTPRELGDARWALCRQRI